MKKSTLSTIYTVMSQNDFLNKEEIMAEIAKELNRGAEEKARKANEYESAKEVVFNAIANEAHTIAEIFEIVKDELPSGFTKNKIQYGLTHLWSDEIAKVEGKVNSYMVRA